LKFYSDIKFEVSYIFKEENCSANELTNLDLDNRENFKWNTVMPFVIISGT